MSFIWVRLLDKAVERFWVCFLSDGDIHNFDQGKAAPLSDWLRAESQVYLYISLKPELPPAEFEAFKH